MNIDKIDIVNNNIKLTILPEEHKVIKADLVTDITEEEIDEFFRIISVWDNNYYSSTGFDGNSFTVRIYYDGKVDTFKGIRKMPDNYNDFNTFVRKLNDRR